MMAHVVRPAIEIKDNIKNLCVILNYFTSTVVKPDYFRQAKHNHSDVTKIFWTLLNEFLNIHGEIECTLETDLSVQEIKHSMIMLGYRNCRFLTLPEDMSCGSRQLLLAFSWLMGKYHIVDMCCDRVMMPFPEDIADSYLLQEPPISTKPFDSKKYKFLPTTKSVEGVCDYVGQSNFLVWLLGKMRLSWRSQVSQELTKCNLYHKIHKVTQQVSLRADGNHLSSMEAFLLQSPDLWDRFSKRLNQENQVLYSLLQWKMSEEVYYKWVEGIIVKEESEVMTMSGDMISFSMVGDFLKPALVFQAEEQHLQLVKEARDLLEACNKIFKQLNAVKKEMDGESYKLPVTIKPGLPHVNKYQFKLVNIKDKKKEVKSVNSPTEEIERLNQSIQLVSKAFEKNQEEWKEELEGILSRFQNVICILPTQGRKSTQISE